MATFVSFPIGSRKMSECFIFPKKWCCENFSNIRRCQIFLHRAMLGPRERQAQVLRVVFPLGFLTVVNIAAPGRHSSRQYSDTHSGSEKPFHTGVFNSICSRLFTCMPHLHCQTADGQLIIWHGDPPPHRPHLVRWQIASHKNCTESQQVTNDFS